MSQDEVRLIERAKEGDPAAFAEIYEQCQPAIFRYVLCRVGDTATAEDLTGEVFVRLVEKIDQFTYRGYPLLAWLYTIARNLVADHHRYTGQIPQLPLDERMVTSTSDPEGAVELKLTQGKLIAAIAQLTESQQQVIILRFLEGLDNKTVAHILGKSVGAVKALQHRGLAALRRTLKRRGMQIE
ncbi:MAG: sigma-70 family RNA polymerase sigma factor [Anaerolineae bacterium]|jgi:RNA polymerase sigma-70 factor (ECF subfamily)